MCQGKGQVWQKELILLQLMLLETNFLAVWAGAWAESWRVFKVLRVWECEGFCEDGVTCRC